MTDVRVYDQTQHLSPRLGDRADPVRLAVVGLGYWGPNLVRNAIASRSADLRAICDLTPSRLDGAGRSFPGIPREADYQRILSDPEIEAVMLCTPLSTHFDLAAEALRSGKHVFVEKPLAASVAESTELAALAADRGLTLMPGHTFVYSPAVALIDDLIKSGTLGTLHYISMSRVNLGIHHSDASVLWDLAPHDFAILRHWLGTVPDAIAATGRGCIMPAIHDVAFINLEYPTGIIAHVELSWLAPSKLRRVVVVGSEKMVVYDDTSGVEPVRIFDAGVDTLPNPRTFGEFRLSYRTGSIVSPAVDAAEPLAIETEDFCRAVRYGSEPRSSWALGHDVVRMIEAADESLRTKERAFVPPTAVERK